MASRRGETYRKLSIPPFYGFPKERRVAVPTENPSNMWLVRLDDTFKQNVEKLKIQTVPMEISVVPESTWAAIPSLGRNNPFYNYTGGEDSLEMTLDWYSMTENKEDVIDKCRWVESLSKADAYVDEPPRVLLIFGQLFRQTTWIIEKAPYKLSMFDKSRGMFPRQAYQELTLKKVTDRNTGTLDRQFFG